MTKLIAVSIAIGDELNRKGWWPPRNLDAKMGKDYHYDADTVTLFLMSVRHRLQTGVGEAYTFSFSNAFAKKSRAITVAELIGAIDDIATIVAPAPAMFAAKMSGAVPAPKGGRARAPTRSAGASPIAGASPRSGRKRKTAGRK